MALFANEEEKKKKKEEKELQKIQNLIKKYGLENLSPEEAKLLPQIAMCFKGNGMIDLGSFMTGDDSAKLWNIQSLNEAMFTQNWMIVNQLTKLNNNIEKLIELYKTK